MQKISVVTPTFMRPDEVQGLLENISRQSMPVTEVILVDGAPAGEVATRDAVGSCAETYSFQINYIRHQGGTAIQRNAGIDHASGDLIALIDDDVRLEDDFFETIVANFTLDENNEIGGIVGYRSNEHSMTVASERWRWYKRLRLLTVFEPGRYDFKTGYPINANLQPPFSGVRPVDFMTTSCAVWRREVFDSGLRFHSFFKDYGVLEDAHFSLRAGRTWKLLQAGDARCVELRASGGRQDRRRIGFKSVVNYYFVFTDIAGPLTWSQQYRFWRYQAFEFFRISMSAIRRRNWGDMLDLRGRLDGMLAVAGGLERS